MTELQPDNAVAWNSRCWARAIAGQFDGAVSDCNEALRLKPDYINAIDSRAFAKLRAGRFKQAIEDYDQPLQLEPRKGASLYGRGVARRQSGDDTGGNADITLARAFKPNVAVEFSRYGAPVPAGGTTPARIGRN